LKSKPTWSDTLGVFGHVGFFLAFAGADRAATAAAFHALIAFSSDELPPKYAALFQDPNRRSLKSDCCGPFVYGRSSNASVRSFFGRLLNVNVKHDYYYSQSGRRCGPVSGEQLKLLAASGQLQPTDLIWKEGMSGWVPAGKVNGLNNLFPVHPGAATGYCDSRGVPVRTAEIARATGTGDDEAIRTRAPTSNPGLAATATPVSSDATQSVQIALIEIIGRYGRDLGSDARRCGALLKDFCPQDKLQINLLVYAVKESVPADLLGSSGGMPKGVLISRLTKRLQDNHGCEEHRARWAVESWAVALGVLSANDTALDAKTDRIGTAITPASSMPVPASPISTVPRWLVSAADFAQATRDFWLSGAMNSILPKLQPVARQQEPNSFARDIVLIAEFLSRNDLPMFSGEAFVAGGAGNTFRLTTHRLVLTAANAAVVCIPLGCIQSYSFRGAKGTIRGKLLGSAVQIHLKPGSGFGQISWQGPALNGLDFVHDRVVDALITMRLWLRLPAEAQSYLGSHRSQILPNQSGNLVSGQSSLPTKPITQSTVTHLPQSPGSRWTQQPNLIGVLAGSGFLVFCFCLSFLGWKTFLLAFLWIIVVLSGLVAVGCGVGACTAKSSAKRMELAKAAAGITCLTFVLVKLAVSLGR
jgi:hypothetical protein